MFRAGLVALSFMWALCAHGKVLYTGSSTPGSQGWLGPIAGTQTLDPGGFVTLDTSASPLLQGGYGLIEPLLESSPGFRLDFTARVDNETHSNDDRAGFSLHRHRRRQARDRDRLLGRPDLAAECRLLSRSKPRGDFDTSAMTDYSLTVIGSHYELRAERQRTAGRRHRLLRCARSARKRFPVPHPARSVLRRRHHFGFCEVLPAIGRAHDRAGAALLGLLCAGLALLTWTLRRSARTPITPQLKSTTTVRLRDGSQTCLSLLRRNRRASFSQMVFRPRVRVLSRLLAALLLSAAAATPTLTIAKQRQAQAADAGWLIYRNDRYAFRLAYPPDSRVDTRRGPDFS